MGSFDRAQRIRTFATGLGLAVAMLAAGCEGQDPEAFDEGWRNATLAPPTGGGGFINNGLDDPDLGGIYPAYPLDTVAGLDGSELDSAARLATARYVVECALPAGERVTKVVGGSTVEFHGALGLAPEWQDEECDEECQEWVSACVLARTNTSGTTVQLWLKAEHPAIGFDSNPAYPSYEASFFGNLFLGPEQAFVCPGQASGPVLARLQGRTCSNAEDGWCGFTSYTGCSASSRCTFVGTPAAPTAVDCRAGAVPSGAPLRTISTYVGAP